MEQRRLLLVEDDDDLRALMRRYLSGGGYHVSEASCVADAVDALQHSAPDLLLLDIGLPDGTGWDVARHLRLALGERVPIVICSSQEPDPERRSAYVIADYIAKPFEPRALCARVAGALASRPAVRPRPERESPPAPGPEAVFYSSLAHDMRTPMSTLQTAVESLLDDEAEWDAETRREFLQAIANSAERVGRYARDVVDLARIEARAFSPRAIPLDPYETVEVVLRSLQRALRSAAPLKVRVAQDPGLAWGDPAFVQRILTVLVENAIQYTPGEREMSLVVDCDADTVTWRVSDSGPGVPPEERERVFTQAFRKESGKSARTGGPRIGLHLCSRLAALQNGRLWVEDAETGGACFCLALPRAV